MKDIRYILHISTKTYYQVLRSRNEDKCWKVTKCYEKGENALLLELELQRNMGDFFSSSQVFHWLETYIKENWY